jgi:hypothetical protein
MRGRILLVPIGLVWAFVFAASCSDEGAGPGEAGGLGIPEGGPGHLTPVCEPDTVTHCTGDGGCLGGKLCGQDGTYGECACVGDTGPTANPDAKTPRSDAARESAADGGLEDTGNPDVLDARSPETGAEPSGERG